ncbi:hypothetical protein HaLaN_23123 [Haematococcus lacustris]|uniref:Uncharacterized protein n=1 Tax=Haematococcus lacustris TaxID=44745 RepID=A0A699ZQV6_HAELA|nr:hypothetical protein HaLaN_23123 [Haematococcus lacustris]
MARYLDSLLKAAGTFDDMKGLSTTMFSL